MLDSILRCSWKTGLEGDWGGIHNYPGKCSFEQVALESLCTFQMPVWGLAWDNACWVLLAIPLGKQCPSNFPACLGTEVPNLFEPLGTFGILIQSVGCNHKMATIGGGANYDISGIEVMHNSNSNSSMFQAHVLFSRMYKILCVHTVMQ